MKALLAVLGACLATGSCAKKQEAPRRTEPWLATPSGVSSVAVVGAPVLYRFTKESRITFALPGRKATPRGRVPLLRGELLLNAAELVRSTAKLEADLTLLEMDGESMPDAETRAGDSPSGIARQWLELGSSVPQERVRSFGHAKFELASLESLSAPSLRVAPGTKGGEVRATIVGTLLLHGFRAPMRAEVALELKPRGPDLAPTLAIRTRSPFVVSLATHEISARDASGTLLPLEAKRLLENVGKDARVELELFAEPESTATSP